MALAILLPRSNFISHIKMFLMEELIVRGKEECNAMHYY